jgi:hypothetical protein
MGFTPTFYAGRPKLSEVTIDSDLDMGGRDILRVGRVDSPYMPETWPTEELDWGDLPEQTVLTVDTDIDVAGLVIRVAEFTAPNKGLLWQMVFDTWTQYSETPLTIRIFVNEVEIDTLINPGATTVTHNKQYVIPANASVIVTTKGQSGFTGKIKAGSYIKCIGTVMEDTTFDLTNKWLALGIDMEGLTATVKIQGVDVPYSDYAKYFPLAPSELTISGVWDVSQTRPIVEVYK